MSTIAAISPQLRHWRERMAANRGLTREDIDELEDHLLSEYQRLASLPLTPPEAFLIAENRLGAARALSAEYLTAHPDRAWQQLPAASQEQSWHLPLAIGLGLVAGLFAWLPTSMAIPGVDRFYALLIVPLVLAIVAIYLVATATTRDRLGLLLLGGGFALTTGLVNLYPLATNSQSLALSALFLPVFLVALTGFAQLGRRWRNLDAWLDWVRFVGEGFIYYVLIALGGGVCLALLLGVLALSGAGGDPSLEIVIFGAVGALFVSAWLVERKKAAMENIAPVLTTVFTPILTLVAVASLLAMAGGSSEFNRELLTIVDLLLIVIGAVVLFTVSARPTGAPPRPLDWLQLTLVCAAVLVDLAMLWTLGARIAEFDITPNRLATLGLNLVLLVHLVGSVYHYFGLVNGKPAVRLERWQALALPVLATWGLIVAIVFPPIFNFQ
ncbi:MAG: hypothetical protein Q4D89_14855 [Arachnia propionica]|uniref:hypothetical protein n=1 Tax=Arachnia propionica TaxID=1750 RepID=UPI0027038550|nr:hypothetical protein [Arachnia propionica]